MQYSNVHFRLVDCWSSVTERGCHSFQFHQERLDIRWTGSKKFFTTVEPPHNEVAKCVLYNGGIFYTFHHFWAENIARGLRYIGFVISKVPLYKWMTTRSLSSWIEGIVLGACPMNVTRDKHSRSVLLIWALRMASFHDWSPLNPRKKIKLHMLDERTFPT